MRRLVFLAAVLLLIMTDPAFAGRILITGTSAVSFWDDTAYGIPLASILGSDIAYLNDHDSPGVETKAGMTVTSINDLSGGLDGYTGLFVGSPGNVGCCSDPATDPD